MLGRDHLTLSVLTFCPFLVPILLLYPQFNILVVVAILGIGIGSISPDVDAVDAMINHMTPRNMRTNNPLRAIAQFGPIFAYPLKYCAYLPLVFFFKYVLRNKNADKPYDVEGHRKIFHSLIGLTVATMVLSILLIIVFTYTRTLDWSYLLIFAISFAIGFFMHLLEDSCTVSGVDHLRPYRSFYISGVVSTRNLDKQRPPVLFSYALLAITIFATGYTVLALAHPSWPLNFWIIAGFELIAVVAWAIFIIFVAKVTRSLPKIKISS